MTRTTPGDNVETLVNVAAPYDATRLQNWQISEAAEENMPTPRRWQEKLGLVADEIIPMGRLGCVSCGDCVRDHLNYVGCSMRWCCKELRNGPCGGSRSDGSCEARPELPCIWNKVYLGTLAMGDDSRKFADLLIPPRDWSLDRTNALVNRFAGLDNLAKRVVRQHPRKQDKEGNKIHADHR